MKQLLIIIFILIAGGAKGYTKDFDYSHITPHPRLLLKEGEERNIHMVLQKNTVLQAFHKRILDYCDETLKESKKANGFWEFRALFSKESSTCHMLIV